MKNNEQARLKSFKESFMNVSKTLRSSLLLALVMVFAASCANDKTFEGKWKNTANSYVIEFRGDKTGTIYNGSMAIIEINSWKANFTKKTIETTAQVSASSSVATKAKYKFTKNFKKLKLSSLEVDPSAYKSVVVDMLQGDYEKQ